MSTDGYRVGRKVHLIIGMIGALWLIFMSVTGVLINHQDSLGLGDKEVSDHFLPAGYRTDVRTGSTRLNVIITDLHSGRFFGPYGYLVGDTIALLLVLSVISGLYMYFFSKRVRAANGQNAAAAPPARVEGPLAQTGRLHFEADPMISAVEKNLGANH